MRVLVSVLLCYPSGLLGCRSLLVGYMVAIVFQKVTRVLLRRPIEFYLPFFIFFKRRPLKS